MSNTVDMESPIYQKEDGDWWHCDEVWCDEFGPFSDKQEAEYNLNAYCNYLNTGDGSKVKWDLYRDSHGDCLKDK